MCGSVSHSGYFSYNKFIALILSVTGTSSGLGNALLHELLTEGHSVIATSRKPGALQAELNGIYDVETIKRALVVGLDVSKIEEVKAVFAKAIERFGRLDIVVNNAGYVSFMLFKMIWMNTVI